MNWNYITMGLGAVIALFMIFGCQKYPVPQYKPHSPDQTIQLKQPQHESTVCTQFPLSFTWDSISSATSYSLEIGSSEDSNDILTESFPQPMYTWEPTHAGTVYWYVIAYKDTIPIAISEQRTLIIIEENLSLPTWSYTFDCTSREITISYQGDWQGQKLDFDVTGPTGFTSIHWNGEATGGELVQVVPAGTFDITATITGTQCNTKPSVTETITIYDSLQHPTLETNFPNGNAPYSSTAAAWTTHPGHEYIFEYRLKGEENWNPTNEWNTSGSASVSNLSPGLYQWRVRVRTMDGCEGIPFNGDEWIVFYEETELTATQIIPNSLYAIIDGRNSTPLVRGVYSSTGEYIDFSLTNGPYLPSDYGEPTSFSVSASILNIGSIDSGNFEAKLYLSADKILDIEGTIYSNDIQLGGEKAIFGLNSGESETITWDNLTIPWDWMQGSNGSKAALGEGGQAYLIVFVDAYDKIIEAEEGNNHVVSDSTFDVRRKFATWDNVTNQAVMRPFQKLAAGDKINLWVVAEDIDGDGINATDEINHANYGGAEAIISQLESGTGSYSLCVNIFIQSEDAIHDMNNNGKIDFLFYDILENGTSPDSSGMGYTAGFFRELDLYPDNDEGANTAAHTAKGIYDPSYISNMLEVIHVDTENPNTPGEQIDRATITHELANFLTYNQNVITEGGDPFPIWLGEMLGSMAEHIVHGKDSLNIYTYLAYYKYCYEGSENSWCPSDPSTYQFRNGRGLLTWDVPANSVLYDHAYSYLLGAYLYYQASSDDQGDASIFKDIVTHASSLEDNVLTEVAKTYGIIENTQTWEDLLVQFHIARYLNKPTGKFGWKDQLNTGVTQELIQATDTSLSSGSTANIYSGGAIFRQLEADHTPSGDVDGPDDNSSIDIINCSFTNEGIINETPPFTAGSIFLSINAGIQHDSSGYDTTGALP